MTLEEILQRLALTPRTWRVIPIAGRPHHHPGMIRCEIPGHCLPVCRCPIIMLMPDPRDTRNADVMDAAENLGIDEYIAYRVLVAADGSTESPLYDPTLRQQLLEACGL